MDTPVLADQSVRTLDTVEKAYQERWMIRMDGDIIREYGNSPLSTWLDDDDDDNNLMFLNVNLVRREKYVEKTGYKLTIRHYRIKGAFYAILT